MFLIYIVYLFAATLLAIYGINELILTALYLRQRKEMLPLPETHTWPHVTVQVPTYNERYVIDRVLDAVAKLDYPRDRLQIQILDDSCDETTARAAQRIALYHAQGLDISLHHRRDRYGFKAGALQAGLAGARGEIIAIFDADFVPPPDFLRRTVPYFMARPRLGFLQTRWGHLNDAYSAITRTQALALDGHFVVEQTARYRSGLFMNFNGTAGLWRRACIENAGGWRGDTVCEDLDLSYRAQLAGWDCLFLPDVEVPGEIPPQITAYKRQQFRWAKGSMQCARLLAGDVLHSKNPLFKRLEGILHLTGYLVHPLLILLLLSSLPLMIVGGSFHLPMAYLSLASLGPPLLYAAAQHTLYPDWKRRYMMLPMLMLLGTGVAVNNSIAVYRAISGQPNRFRRTPKFGLESRDDRWVGKAYMLSVLEPATLAEFALSLYALAGVVLALQQGNGWAVPFLLLYVFGFGYVGLLTLLHSTRLPWSTRQRTAIHLSRVKRRLRPQALSRGD